MEVYILCLDKRPITIIALLPDKNYNEIEFYKKGPGCLNREEFINHIWELMASSRVTEELNVN
jgi:hypothetical protein